MEGGRDAGRKGCREEEMEGGRDGGRKVRSMYSSHTHTHFLPHQRTQADL